jgi:ATP-binding cassette subfamily B multidrug efflux pump
MTAGAVFRPPKSHAQRPWLLLSRFIRQHIMVYIVAVCAIALGEILQAQIPHLIGRFVNQLKERLSSNVLAGDIEILVLYAAAYVTAFGFGQYLVGRYGRIYEYELRQHLFEHWLSLSADFFQEYHVGDLLSYALNDVPALREAISGGIIQIVQATFLIVATLYMTIVHISYKLALFGLLPLATIPITAAAVSSMLRVRARKVKEALTDMASLAEEYITAIRPIKAMALENVLLERFRNVVNRVFERTMTSVRWNVALQSVIPLLSNMSFVVAIVYGGYLVSVHAVSLGALVAFTLYLRMITNPLAQVGQITTTFQTALASAERIQNLLSIMPTVRDQNSTVTVVSHYHISIRHLTFSYPNRSQHALKNISINIPEGSFVGIVGPTGGGKSTLLRLLIREFEPPSGSIFIGDHDIRQISLKVLRGALMAYVSQKVFLFATTIGQNIAFPLTSSESSQVDRNVLESAAQKAQILDPIRKFPREFETMVGERGLALSGGQKQRTALARALIQSQAKILLLDDVMSAVDFETESRLVEALQTLRGTKTILLSSHRISSVMSADCILVLDHGQVVEMGTHAQLVRQNGLYARLHALQRVGEEDVSRG